MADKIDILNRQEFVAQLISIIRQLTDNGHGCTFAIDGQWGSGKSYVLDMLEKEINLFQHPDAAGDRYIVFRYDCWQYDYYEEPAVAVISAMISSFERDRTIFNKDLEDTVEAGYLFVGKKLKEIAGLYLKNRIGVDLISWAGEIASIKKGNASAEYNFDKMFNFSQTIEMVRKDLQEMAEQRTILLVVDELDNIKNKNSGPLGRKAWEVIRGISYGDRTILMDYTGDSDEENEDCKIIFIAQEASDTYHFNNFCNFFSPLSRLLLIAERDT